MTSHPYHTTQSSTEQNIVSTDQHPIVRQAILNDIARNAIIDDEMLAPLSMNIEVDDKGTVIINALEQDARGTVTDRHRRVICVPQEKAYQRIVDAAQRKIGLLEQLYEENRREAQSWFNRSFLTAIVEAIIITFSIFLPILLYSLQLNAHILSITGLAIVINVINACITAWVFYQTKQANDRTDLYLCSLNEVRSFSTITHFIAQLNIDDQHKHLLQKTLISTSLGLSTRQIAVESKHYQTEPLADE
ncbi:hypothetical protein [Dictyobacter kobayashii]|uniref:Uncharacterized protein n=1 Tax=Dictyobacter kobayashii TaxID=2014872 RepID=A0A402AJP7_9CHLR|nr:hypothetical protein [Dictyobacter kobayashii]GCE19408.1 hypothetical protein KDK_32080 [Dictyobacter kobayashii]